MSNPTSLILFTAGGVIVGAVAGSMLSQPSAPESTTSASAGTAQLQLDERHQGEITSSSELNGNDGSRFLRHQLTLSQDELVEVALRGPLSGRLALYDDSEQLVAQGDATLRWRSVEDGDYLLVVSGDSASSYGPYNLTARLLDLELSEAGTILESDSQLRGWFQDDGEEHTLRIEEAGLYQLEMSSDDFDPYLTLQGANNLYFEDDDSAGDFNARISAYLEAGEYQVGVQRSPYSGDIPEEGLYRLAISSLALENELQNGGELPLEGSLYGWYNAGVHYDESPLEYELSLSEETMVTMEMLADDFDAYLMLEGEGLTFTDDDGGDGTNARLRQRLPAGDYVLTARSFGSYGASGVFELKVHTSAPDEQAGGGQLTLDEPVSAWLYEDARDEYLVQIETAGGYRLDMVSDELDSYLELTGNGVHYSDDDSGEHFNARLSVHLEPGDYYVIARSYGSYESGPYELILSEE